MNDGPENIRSNGEPQPNVPAGEPPTVEEVLGQARAAGGRRRSGDEPSHDPFASEASDEARRDGVTKPDDKSKREHVMELVGEGKVKEALELIIPDSEGGPFVEHVSSIMQKEYAKNQNDPSEDQLEKSQIKLTSLLEVTENAWRNPDMARETVERLGREEIITEEEKAALLDNIPEKTSEEVKEDTEVPPERQEQIDEASGLTGEAKAQLEELQEGLKKEGESGYNTPTQRFLRNRLSNMQGRMHHLEEWFKQPKEVWAGRAGKTLLCAVVALALFMLWEMKTINKLSGTKK